MSGTERNNPPTVGVASSPLTLGLRGEATAWLEVKTPTLTWGDALVGHLVLQGGKMPYRITRPIDVSLSFSDGETSRLLAEQRLLSPPHTVEAGATQLLSIRLVVPAGAPLEPTTRLGFDIGAGPWLQSSGMLIQIVPPGPCLIAADQIASLTGLSVAGWTVGKAGEVVGQLKSNRRDAPFHRATLELLPDDGTWHGRLSVARRGRWWHEDTRQFEILALGRNAQEVRKQFEKPLQNAAFQLGAGRELPLPAGTPDALPSTLPLPVDRNPQTGPDDE